MNDETFRMIFGEIQQGIRDGRKDVYRLREEILALLREHRRDIDEGKAFRLKLAGAYTMLVIVIELAIKAAEHLIK